MGIQENKSELVRLSVFACRVVRSSLKRLIKYPQRKRFPKASNRWLEPFLAERAIVERDYEDLFRYFLQGWHTYRVPEGSGALYPGLPSVNGGLADLLEGFARSMPLFGAWVYGGRSHEVTVADGTALSLPGEFARGLVAGTDPGAHSYWGAMHGWNNQRVVEAADVALALWFFRSSAWSSLSSQEQERAIVWLSRVVECSGPDNNWHLFYVLVDRVLTALGYPGRIPEARERFERVKSFHLGDGWFEDGPKGKVDFYNAWGFHYTLALINRIDPEWDPAFIQDVQRRFAPTLMHFISPEGIPILGRSVPYRMALPAPLVLGCADRPELVPAPEARRALDVVWRYFIRRGAVTSGTVTQGYYGADPRLLDGYSGPASPLWSLRSLVAAFSIPSAAPFWQEKAGLLPVEKGDYELTLEGPRWRVLGDHKRKAVVVEVLDNALRPPPSLEEYTLKHRIQSLAYEQGVRPSNLEAKYRGRHYRSDVPFFEAT